MYYFNNYITTDFKIKLLVLSSFLIGKWIVNV